MAIAWITTKIDSEMVKTFQTAHWEIKSFTPPGFIYSKSLTHREIDIIILNATDRASLVFCEEVCRRQIAPVLAIVGDLAYAQAVLEAGAEDFLMAPVQPIEALLRVRKLARSAYIVRVGELEVDLLAWNVSYRDRRVNLSKIEFRILASLAKRVGQLVEQGTILEEVWSLAAEEKTLAQVKIYIGRLRRKIEPDVQNPQYIITIPGTGYRLRNQRQWQARRDEILKSEMLLKVSAR